VFGLAAVMIGSTAVVASATKPPDHKVTICHATGSSTNPFVIINVDIASSGYLKAGHDLHDDDIIPPYTYGTFSYPGKNWTASGQTILANGCRLAVAAQPSLVTSPTQATSPTQGGSPGAGGSPTSGAGSGAVSGSSASAGSTAGSQGEVLAETGMNSPDMMLGILLVVLGSIGTIAGTISIRRRRTA
jgi:hypothetical protein